MLGLMLNGDNPELLKLERYINDCLSKTQDLFDSIQDLKTLWIIIFLTMNLIKSAKAKYENYKQKYHE